MVNTLISNASYKRFIAIERRGKREMSPVDALLISANMTLKKISAKIYEVTPYKDGVQRTPKLRFSNAGSVCELVEPKSVSYQVTAVVKERLLAKAMELSSILQSADLIVCLNWVNSLVIN